MPPLSGLRSLFLSRYRLKFPAEFCAGAPPQGGGAPAAYGKRGDLRAPRVGCDILRLSARVKTSAKGALAFAPYIARRNREGRSTRRNAHGGFISAKSVRWLTAYCKLPAAPAGEGARKTCGFSRFSALPFARFYRPRIARLLPLPSPSTSRGRRQLNLTRNIYLTFQ